MSVVSSQIIKKYSTGSATINIIDELGLTSYMGVPLKIKNKVIGAITCLEKYETLAKR